MKKEQLSLIQSSRIQLARQCDAAHGVVVVVVVVVVLLLVAGFFVLVF